MIEVLTSHFCVFELSVSDSKKRLFVPDIIHGDEEARMEMLEVLGQEDLSHFEEKELHVRCPTHDIKRANRTSSILNSTTQFNVLYCFPRWAIT